MSDPGARLGIWLLLVGICLLGEVMSEVAAAGVSGSIARKTVESVGLVGLGEKGFCVYVYV